LSQRNRTSRRRRIATGINLTSLLDAIFNLVFFFLLATTLRQEEGQARVQLPHSDTAEEVSIDRKAISLDAQGRIFYGETPIQEAELEIELRRLADRGVTEIMIRGDENVGLGRVYGIMDLCRKSGLEAVSLVSQK
jgi:biopolymer transport protein ExbD